jgi:hypothetical protein
VAQLTANSATEEEVSQVLGSFVRPWEWTS